MRDGSSASCGWFEVAETMENQRTPWRELYRCDDLRQARAVATTIAAMEFDVRLNSLSAAPTLARRHGGPSALRAESSGSESRVTMDELPGPYVVEVPDDTWPQLADVLLEIIAEQQEFDQMLEWRRERNRVRLVLVLSITTAAEVLVIWRLLDA